MKSRNAFFRILLSYLVMMLTPMLILGLASFNFFAKFYDRELVSNRVNSLYKVQSTFDIFINQMNAYAYSLLKSSEFTPAHLNAEYGNFYDVTHKLASVVLTNDFINNIFYINSELHYIFTTETFFRYQDFQAFGPQYNIPVTQTEDYLLQNKRLYWLSLQPVRKSSPKALIYVVTNKDGQTQPTASVFFQIGNQTLRELAGDTGACIIISDDRDSLLYSSDPATSAGVWSSWRKLKDKENGQPVEMTVKSKRFIAFQCRSIASPIKYVVLIPYQKLMAPIESQKMLFMLCLIAIVVIGSLFIAYFMKLNYAPIRSIHKRLAAIFGDASENLNEFEAVEKALVTISDKNNNLLKEKITLKLIRGGYSDLEELDREAGSIGYSLSGPCFRVIVCSVTDKAAGELTAATYQEVARYIENGINPSFEVCAIEYLEDRSVFAVVSGEYEELNEIREKLIHVKNVIESVYQISLSIGVGKVCDIEAIEESFNQAGATSKYHLIKGSSSINFFENSVSEKRSQLAYPNHAIDALYHAIKHGQEERVQFAMDILIRHIADAKSLFFATCLAYDIVNTALKAMRELNYSFSSFNRKYPEILNKDSLKSTDDIIGIVNMLTDEIVNLIIEEENAEPSIDEPLHNFKQVVKYITEHLSEETFSVKILADHCGMSISNFSHYFKKQTGYTVSDYIALLRFEKAKELLRTTDLNLQEIAAKCGYLHISTFMRQFKRRENMTPANFRARFRS